jgi:hypothetical protein
VDNITDLHLLCVERKRLSPISTTPVLVLLTVLFQFIIDFLPAVHTKHKEDRFLPPTHRSDDEMAINTQAQGSMTGGPVYSSGGQGYGRDSESYGSQQPMAQRDRYYGDIPARNF